MSDPGRVTAAPNRSEIRARIVEVEPSPAFADKWHLVVEILDAQSLEGPQLARTGERAKAFVIGASTGLTPGTVIRADAEYVGDARGGQLRLTDVRVESAG